jgi:hypothetical protein
MGQIFILKLLDGIVEQGISALLGFGEDGSQPTHEISCRLPANSSIRVLYDQWKIAFRKQTDRHRPRKFGKQLKETASQTISTTDTCENLAKKVIEELNTWLNNAPGQEWQDARDTLLTKVKTGDRVIIQTQDHLLRQLPWSEWNIF